MAIKKSISISDLTEHYCRRIFNNLAEDGRENWSGAIHTLTQNYDILIQDEIKKLDLSWFEENVYREAFSKIQLNRELRVELYNFTQAVTKVATNTREYHSVDEDTWNDFINKTRKLSDSQKLAIFELCRSS